jgi:cobalt/nickel transport system permease protein
MHIPDGYLAPAVSLALAVPTVPALAIASQRVKKVLDSRTVPLLAIFAAFSFTIMMFNVPVPGGTTAHAVGGTLIAVVLGPWAAIIALCTALVLQALFFGDGGVLAIFANCLNMGILLPLAGYGTYRILAAGSDTLSTRRAAAAGIGAYVGITVAALATGIELGIQPLLFSHDGRAEYSPYGLSEAVPAMLAAHAFGASIVEAAVTWLGVVYLQRRHPELLTGLRANAAGVADGGAEAAAGRGLWRPVLLGVAAAVAASLAFGLVEGGGDPARMWGFDWSGVDWPSIASMLLVTAVIGAVVIPVVHWLLPARVRSTGTAFAALAVIAPIGLIAPGFAYGEGSSAEVEAAFGYVPSGLRDLSSVFGAPLSGYNLPLPFFDEANAPLWHAAIGYEIAGILGILLVGGAVYATASLLRRNRGADAVVSARP